LGACFEALCEEVLMTIGFALRFFTIPTLPFELCVLSNLFPP